MSVRVVRSMNITIQPRAECLGDDADQEKPSNCSQSWQFGRDTLAQVKAHVKANPDHAVLVVHETRSIYEADQ